MRVVRVTQWGGEPTLDAAAGVPARAQGETLVAIEAAAVGQLDLQIATGTFPVHPELPYIPGTDAAGHVVRSDRFAPGTKVWIRGAGVGITRDGCWAEQVAVPDEAVHELTAALGPTVAASFWVPCSTARAALLDVGRLSAGERVAIRGAAGAVGSVAVQMAQAAGAREVLGIVRTRSPSSPFVSAEDPDLIERLTADGGVDLLVDMVGGPDLSRFIEAMSPGGRIALVGYAGAIETSIDLLALITQDVAILPVNQIRRQENLLAAAPELIDQLADGEIRLHVEAFPFERLSAALADVARGGVGGRVVVTLP